MTSSSRDTWRAKDFPPALYRFQVIPGSPISVVTKYSTSSCLKPRTWIPALAVKVYAVVDRLNFYTQLLGLLWIVFLWNQKFSCCYFRKREAEKHWIIEMMVRNAVAHMTKISHKWKKLNKSCGVHSSNLVTFWSPVHWQQMSEEQQSKQKTSVSLTTLGSASKCHISSCCRARLDEKWHRKVTALSLLY